MPPEERPPPWWTQWDHTLQTGAHLAAGLIHWVSGTTPRHNSRRPTRRHRRRWRRWIIIEELEDEADSSPHHDHHDIASVPGDGRVTHLSHHRRWNAPPRLLINPQTGLPRL